MPHVLFFSTRVKHGAVGVFAHLWLSFTEYIDNEEIARSGALLRSILLCPTSGFHPTWVRRYCPSVAGIQVFKDSNPSRSKTSFCIPGRRPMTNFYSASKSFQHRISKYPSIVCSLMCTEPFPLPGYSYPTDADWH